MRERIKSFLKRRAKFLCRLPFVNRLRLRGTRLEQGKAIFAKCRFDCRGTGNSIRFEDGSACVRCTFFIRGNHNAIVIGKNAHVREGEFWIEDDGNRVTVGENTLLCGKTHLACTEGRSITIGRDCLFSSDLVFRTGDSHSLTDLSGRRINPARDITVGDHVWIGHRALICKGVVLPRDCVVGTGAVVTRGAFDEHTVIAGSPARTVRQNVSWDIRRLPANGAEGANE